MRTLTSLWMNVLVMTLFSLEAVRPRRLAGWSVQRQMRRTFQCDWWGLAGRVFWRWPTMVAGALSVRMWDWGSEDAEVACEELGLKTQSIHSIFPSGNYDRYMSRLKPFWLSSVQCFVGDDTIGECGRDSIIGYSASCSGTSSFNVFNSAEVDCGDPIPFMLSGGAIAGIVIACAMSLS